MAENVWTSNSFIKMLGEINAPWCSALKQGAVQYIDTTEKWAQKALELNEQATVWAKETPFAPLFETQRSFVRQMIETSTALAYRLWQIEDKAEEKATAAL
jgi:hypothetical protein